MHRLFPAGYYGINSVFYLWKDCRYMDIFRGTKFESRIQGISGFHCLTITSLVWVGRLLLNGAFISRHHADA
jgi:hypothetical protein